MPSTTKPSRNDPPNPLIRDGLEFIPNIPHVFRQDQHLYFLYEVYDPAHQKSSTPNVLLSSRAPSEARGEGPASASPPPPSPNLTRRPPISGVRVLTSIEFLLGGVKVYETPLVEATAINTPDRGAVAFQFDVPLTPLKPGTYICQVNVIDDAGAAFTFPRLALRITPPQVPAAPTAPIPSAPPTQ